ESPAMDDLAEASPLDADDAAAPSGDPESEPEAESSSKSESESPKPEDKPADAAPADERTDDGSVALALLEGREPSQETSPPSSTPSAAGQYIVQIAAYGAREDAEKRRSRLADSGVTNAYVEAASGENSTAWRLRVGPFSSADAAQAAQTRLRTLGYDNSLLLKQ
ncbi:MAG TPA: SPOR domain-containing protein, partial [Burkholderiaceae bacterium]|nr:SPOR domain-containing protein [Burkholderiaceae bacterium]